MDRCFLLEKGFEYEKSKLEKVREEGSNILHSEWVWPLCGHNYWLTHIYKLNFLNFIVLNLICDDWGYREATPIMSAEKVTPILDAKDLISRGKGN